MSILVKSLYWTLESQWWVVANHAPMLETCAKAGSTTAALVWCWGPVLCFPQWAGILLRIPEGYACFAARYVAMCIVRVLDGKIPCTRALGLCHLSTLGPLYFWLSGRSNNYKEGSLASMFVAAQLKICAACILMDARDLLFHLAGYPYPCYIRTAVKAGAIGEVYKDERAHAEVHWWSAILGP